MKKIASLYNLSRLHLFLGITVCLAVYQIILGKVSLDETEALHTAWKMFTGEVIYRDFFQHHHPLFYYLLLPVIAIGGETLITFYLAELVTAVLFAGIVVTTHKLAGNIYGDRGIALLSVVLLLISPWFIIRGTSIRPDILQVLLGLLSFHFLVLWLHDEPKGRTRGYLLLSALLLSLSLLALQKAIFMIFVVGLILLHRLFAGGGARSDARITVRDFLLYWVLFSLPPALYMVFLLTTGELRDYFDFNWLINMRYMQSFSVLQTLVGNIAALLCMVVLVALFIAGCFAKLPANGGAHRATVLAGGCLIASLFIVKAPNAQYFLMVMPFISIVAAASLRHFFSDVVIRRLLWALVLLCTVHQVEYAHEGSRKREDLSNMRHVLQVAGPEDAYFGYREWNLFRRDADFFWFCFVPEQCLETLQSFREYDWDPVQIVLQTRPKVIGVERKRDGWYTSLVEHPEIAPHYELSPGYPLYTRKAASPQ